MLARITPILIAFVFLAGCEAMGGTRGGATGYDVAPSESETAGIQVQPLGYVKEPYFLDTEYTLNEPVLISVKYAAPDGGESCDFTALVAPSTPGRSFTVEVVTTPTPLLVVTDAHAYVTGKRPAVGGGQTGTLGDGTTFIIEPAVNGTDYVYLIKGAWVKGFDIEVDPVALDENNPLTPKDHYRGFRWDGSGHEPILKIDNAMNADRKKSMDRMIRLAQMEGLYPPPP